MITSTSSTDRAARAVSLPPAPPSAQRAAAAASDRVSTDSAAVLRAALQRQPEIRPDVVARARALVTDPSYPPNDVVKMIAMQILAARDLSEDES